ncbi:MAG: hypothetical protein GX051_06720 [Clostridiales bacterium]|nr:hypothetical protein [Clostridiales bacterium]
MELKIGSVVRSKAGRDKGSFLVVVSLCEQNGYVNVCDGKERPLERPKRKNACHLAVTNTVLPPEDTAANHRLKKALNAFASAQDKTQGRCF